MHIKPKDDLKNLTAIVVAFLFGGTILLGCGSPGESPSPESPKPSRPQASSSETAVKHSDEPPQKIEARSAESAPQSQPQTEATHPAPPKPAASAPVKLPRMVDLGAEKCVPCKAMAPILRDLKVEFKGKVDVEFIDVWKDPEPGRQYRIRVIPTQIFFDAQGRELFRHEGFYSREDILAKWREFGFIKG